MTGPKKVTHERIAKMRAATIFGLCNYLGIGQDAWANYKGKPDFAGVCGWAENMQVPWSQM